MDVYLVDAFTEVPGYFLDTFQNLSYLLNNTAIDCLYFAKWFSFFCGNLELLTMHVTWVAIIKYRGVLDLFLFFQQGDKSLT